MKLYEIADNLRNLLESVGEDGEIPKDLAEQIKAAESSLQDKLEACCVIRREAQIEADAYADEVDRLTRKRRALDRKAEWLLQYMQDCLVSLGETEVNVRDGLYSLKIQDTPGAVEITNSDMVPEQFVETSVQRSISKQAIAAVLRAGEEVPGCKLVVRQVLRIY